MPENVKPLPEYKIGDLVWCTLASEVKPMPGIVTKEYDSEKKFLVINFHSEDEEETKKFPFPIGIKSEDFIRPRENT